MHNKGRIFNLQRFSTSDGPGIRTVIFFKGCPLNCSWCHNPESKSSKAQILFKNELCIGCGKCIEVCSLKGHTLEKGKHIFLREECKGCGECANNCCTKALELCGEEKTAEEIINIALRDQPFYKEAGGGITLSGGEPLMQYEFCLELLRLAKENNLHTAIETSGYSLKDITALNEFTDLWLYDIKVLNEQDHIKYIGASNKVILENLYKLNSMGANIILRCPVIPHINMNPAHFEKLSRLANSLANLTEIHLEPYHPLGISKAQLLGKNQSYQNEKFLEPSALQPFAKALKEKVSKQVIII